MEWSANSAKRLSFVRPCLLALGLLFGLFMVVGAWSQPVAAADGDELTVWVDGRAVTVEGVEAQLNGSTATYTEVLKVIGLEPVTADLVEVFAPPDTPILVTNVAAEVHGRTIKVTNLAQTLAARGRIGIWISGANWRVCIIFTWGSKANLDVSVDGRDVTVEGTEAQLQGQLVPLPQLLAFLGPDLVTAERIELFNPANPTVTSVVTEGVQAIVHGNTLHLTGLAREVALRGRIGIWVSGSGWRICIIIRWESKANLDVSVDGREVTVEGTEAQLNGQSVELRRVLAFLGAAPVTAEKIELFDTATPTITKVLTQGVQAVIKESHLSLTGLSTHLARGRIGIWVSGSGWRICIIIVWGNKANLDVTVDGRVATLQSVAAEYQGRPTDLRRVLALLGTTAVTAQKIERFDPANPSSTTVLTQGVQAVMEGSHLRFTGLSPHLAPRPIGLWITILDEVRVCIILAWGSHANLNVTVDGRDVTLKGLEAQVDGQMTELRQIQALLDGAAETAGKIELFDPANPGVTKVLTQGVQAILDDDHLLLTGLGQELAARTQIGIWISGKRWRICIIITWESKANLAVTVDGREVTNSEPIVEIDGQPTEVRRLLALLGSTPVVADKVELFKPTLGAAAVLTDPVIITPTQKVTATVTGNQVRFTGLANTLAKHKTIGIWISGRNWRVCITITLRSANSPRVVVDGRPVIAYHPEAELDGQPVDPQRVLTFLGKQEVTADKIEIQANGQPVTDSDAKAMVKDGQILLTNLADTLAARGRISIWISGSRWRICIIIEWGRFTSTDGQVKVDLPATDAHAGVDLLYTSIQTPTHPLPPGKRGLRLFRLIAENSQGDAINQFEANYNLEVSYTDADLAKLGIVEGTLKLYFYDEATGQWVLVATTLDAPNNKAMGALDHFTEFALLGDPVAQPTTRSLFLPLIQK
ncbi:MAG: hypothetical protein DYG89_00905 [Caldilinea sp. CFX5]|nr:hypothetical protein [Caldilinea sp. CFX5]